MADPSKGGSPAGSGKGERRCGAKNRPGAKHPYCINPPMKGKRRCRMHGGKSPGGPKGNKKRQAHGFYSRSLSQRELELLEAAPIGTLDAEIKMLRVKLARAYEADAAYNAAIEGAEPQEVIDLLPIEAYEDGISGMGIMQKLVKRRRDFTQEIIQLTRLLVQAESKRAEIAELSREEGAAERFVQDARAFAEAALQTLPGPVEDS